MATAIDPETPNNPIPWALSCGRSRSTIAVAQPLKHAEKATPCTSLTRIISTEYDLKNKKPAFVSPITSIPPTTKILRPCLSIKGASIGSEPSEVIPMDPITKPTSTLSPPRSTITSGRKLQVATTRKRKRFVAAISKNCTLNRIDGITIIVSEGCGCSNMKRRSHPSFYSSLKSSIPLTATKPEGVSRPPDRSFSVLTGGLDIPPDRRFATSIGCISFND